MDRRVDIPRSYRDAYKAGQQDRDINASKDANPYPITDQQRWWWFAGFNDRDIELKKEV